MATIDPRDPDAPDPDDRTMQRLEMAASLDELFPGLLAGLAGAVQRRDVLLGRMSPATWPAGVELAGWDASQQSQEAVELPWRVANWPYVILSPPVSSPASPVWVRAWPGVRLGSYSIEAALLTRQLDPPPVDLPDGVRRWLLLTEDERPVQLTDDPAGRDRPRDWVLRADTTYQIEYDADGGWLVYGLTVPD